MKSYAHELRKFSPVGQKPWNLYKLSLSQRFYKLLSRRALCYVGIRTEDLDGSRQKDDWSLPKCFLMNLVCPAVLVDFVVSFWPTLIKRAWIVQNINQSFRARDLVVFYEIFSYFRGFCKTFKNSTRHQQPLKSWKTCLKSPGGVLTSFW